MTRFIPSACVFSLLVLTSLVVVLGKREHGVHLAHECVRILSLPVDKLPVIFLHGLTDSKETWNGLYQDVSFFTGRRVCIYDARNHGDSGWNDTFELDALSEDLGNFMTAMNIEKAALVGHSLGGLTVMDFTLKNPDKVECVFVEDISPSIGTNETAETLKQYLKLLLGSASSIPADADKESAKKAVIDYFTNATGMPPPSHLFNTFPFRCQDGVWQWKANFKGILKSLDDVDSFFGKLEGVNKGKAFFIYGEASPIKVFDDKENIVKLFPNVEFFGVEGADHVIHATNRTLYLNKLVKFLN